jgi:hypothetical protein
MTRIIVTPIQHALHVRVDLLKPRGLAHVCWRRDLPALDFNRSFFGPVRARADRLRIRVRLFGNTGKRGRPISDSTGKPVLGRAERTQVRVGRSVHAFLYGYFVAAVGVVVRGWRIVDLVREHGSWVKCASLFFLQWSTRLRASFISVCLALLFFLAFLLV